MAPHVPPEPGVLFPPRDPGWLGLRLVLRRERAGDRGGAVRSQRRLALFAFVAFLLVLPAIALAFPPLSGRVVDDAGVLDEGTRAALTQKLAEFEAKTTDQFVVVTLTSLQ